MGLLTLAEAAERLGVTKRQVQHLAARGEVRAVARGVLDETSVERYRAARGDSPRRPWAEATAWAAIALLSGGEAAWLGPAQRSRLRSRLRELPVDELVGRARGRAVVTRYAGHPSTAARLRERLVDTAAAAESLGLAATSAVDGYAPAADVDVLIARHGLLRDDDGRLTIRATTMPLDVVAELAHAAPVLAALDLAESLDTRERAAGRRVLAAALERFRG